MKNYRITVNGNVYDVVVEEGAQGAAPAYAPKAAPRPAAAPAPAPVAAPAPAPASEPKAAPAEPKKVKSVTVEADEADFDV